MSFAYFCVILRCIVQNGKFIFTPKINCFSSISSPNPIWWAKLTQVRPNVTFMPHYVKTEWRNFLFYQGSDSPHRIRFLLDTCTSAHASAPICVNWLVDLFALLFGVAVILALNAASWRDMLIAFEMTVTQCWAQSTLGLPRQDSLTKATSVSFFGEERGIRDRGKPFTKTNAG